MPERPIPVAALLYSRSLAEVEFESRRGDGCLFRVSVMCYKVEVSATGRSFIQNFYRM